MMTVRLNCAILVVLAVTVTVIPAALSASSEVVIAGKSPSAAVSSKEASQNTNGIVGTISNFLWPFTTILYEYLDSMLRNGFNMALPCTIYSITPWKVTCTPVP